MNIITHGFARALNKLADGRLGDDYVFAVPLDVLPDFLQLAKKALNGEMIVSKPGKTYDFLTGTDCSISVGWPEPEDVLIPAHMHTLSYMIANLKA